MNTYTIKESESLRREFGEKIILHEHEWQNVKRKIMSDSFKLLGLRKTFSFLVEEYISLADKFFISFEMIEKKKTQTAVPHIRVVSVKVMENFVQFHIFFASVFFGSGGIDCK